MKRLAAPILATAMVAVAVVLAGAVVEVALGQQQWFWESPSKSAPASSPAKTDDGPSAMPLLIDDPSQPDWMVPGIWYCWNTGPLEPHRLGYHVPNDHLCTWGDLRTGGYVYTP